MSDRELIIGFEDEDKQRVIDHLTRLLPYLKPDDFVLVGGLAIRHHLITHGINYPRRPFNDLDIIVRTADTVSPLVCDKFLVYHYHPDDNFLALVDPVSRVKTDVFSYYPSPHDVVKILLCGQEVNIISAEDQLVKTVLDIQKVSSGIKVDPKQFEDARFLMKIADIDKADSYWRENNFSNCPSSLIDAFNMADAIAKKHPEYLQEKPFRKSAPYNCEHCKNVNGFFVSPMDQVYQILGYIE